MDVLKKMGERKALTKTKFKEAQENRRIEHMLDEREKSANQRELERHFKEQQEKQIKEQLDVIRKKRTQDMFKGENLFKDGTSILKNERPILKEKNIFSIKGNMFMK